MVLTVKIGLEMSKTVKIGLLWYQNDPEVILNTYRPSKLPWMTHVALSGQCPLLRPINPAIDETIIRETLPQLDNYSKFMVLILK